MKTCSFDAAPNRHAAESLLHLGGRSNTPRVEQAKQIARRIVEEELTERQRELLLHYCQGRSMSGIALELGINKSTVSRTVARALRRLRERMRFYDFRV